MTILKLFGFAVLSCLIAVVLRAYKQELCIPFILSAGVILLLCAIESLNGVFLTIRDAFTRFGIENSYLQIAVKIIVIAYLVQFASNMCKDAGEGALAGKVEMTGRVLIFSAAAPVILGILEVLSRFMKAL